MKSRSLVDFDRIMCATLRQLRAVPPHHRNTQLAQRGTSTTAIRGFTLLEESTHVAQPRLAEPLDELQLISAGNETLRNQRLGEPRL